MSPPTVLVVDDDPLVRRAMVRALRRTYDVHEAEHAEAASAILARESIDLLLSDIWMPDTDGFALAERARATHPGLAMILITGLMHPDHAARAEALGVSAVLLKPVSASRLRDAIENALGA